MASLGGFGDFLQLVASFQICLLGICCQYVHQRLGLLVSCFEGGVVCGSEHVWDTVRPSGACRLQDQSCQGCSRRSALTPLQAIPAGLLAAFP